MLLVQVAQVQSLVRELDPTCMLQLRVCMPQLRSQPATKTQYNQINILESFYKISSLDKFFKWASALKEL